jgi:hypothetical protein
MMFAPMVPLSPAPIALNNTAIAINNMKDMNWGGSGLPMWATLTIIGVVTLVLIIFAIWATWPWKD